jgi:phenylacetic acid degradation operon negative regulatory protein
MPQIKKELPAKASKPAQGEPWPSLRPQSLMLSFFADYVLGKNIGVFSGSIIEIFERLRVSEEATRSTLARMAERRLLVRQRKGRRIYFGLTDDAIELLEESKTRIWEVGALNQQSADSWTLLAFSLPESWQPQRHVLRTRLEWAGFGPMQSGVWIAPYEVDVAEVVGDLGLDAHFKVFRVSPLHPTDPMQIIRDTYDLAGIAGRYDDFLGRWARPFPLPDAPDAIVRILVLVTDWLEILRQDPRLPTSLLPSDWPAAKAQRVFKELHERYDAPARRIVTSILDVVPSAPIPAEPRGPRAKS